MMNQNLLVKKRSELTINKNNLLTTKRYIKLAIGELRLQPVEQNETTFKHLLESLNSVQVCLMNVTNELVEIAKELEKGNKR
ncbi:MAG: hypothetical protein ACRDCC_10645 [Culicoidibacterales bacterium]